MREERVIDFRRSNLHVVNYSVPFRGRMSLEELRPHLFSTAGSNLTWSLTEPPTTRGTGALPEPEST